ncbi:hypothetical protein NX722_15840 [Endozoicomonas gorgoniicola]|uniref:Uncharacterized protein n=1 Tax=Endozoicomonas gorgoniicola TaxID=1234144 RepID=A0ABT3MXE9_9GAMM|nr:hypothetical protein [Endozoicomonas gorgoniicola]MCW7554061.1 hypothetical protein [Endozoicomonas gorgoniicola]
MNTRKHDLTLKRIFRFVCCLFFATTTELNADTLLMGRSAYFPNNPSSLSFEPQTYDKMHSMAVLPNKFDRTLFEETTLKEIVTASKTTLPYKDEIVELAKKIIVIAIFGRKELIETGESLSEPIENEAYAIIQDADPEFSSYSYSGSTDFMLVALPIEDGKSQTGETAQTSQTGETAQTSQTGETAQTSQSGETAQNKKKPKLRIAIPNTSDARHRRLTSQLSRESKFVRLWLRRELPFENNLPKKLLLREQFKFNRIDNSGHRLTVIAETPEHVKYVIKVTDTSNEDYKIFYGIDPALITFKQAILDALASKQFEEAFKKNFPQYEDQVIFPSTRTAIVSVRDFLENLPDALKTNVNPMISLFEKSLYNNYDSEIFMFVIIQEFIPSLRELNEDDFKRHENLIKELAKLIKDIKEETGQNLLINSDGKIVLIDVELDQIDWYAREQMGELKQDRDAMIEALRTFDDLRYTELDKKSYTELQKSLSQGQLDSSDSGIFSYKSPDEVLEEIYSSDDDVFEP